MSEAGSSFVMDIHQVLHYLPQRYPFLLVDRVLEIVPHQSLTAIKNVTSNEPYFVGHFPHRKVMPGVLMLEALAQACCILAFKSADEQPNERSIYYFAAIEGVRFRRVVEPGDQLLLSVEVLRCKRDFWKFKCVATVNGEVACDVEGLSAKKGVRDD